MAKLLDVTLRDGGLANNFAFTTVEIDRIVSGLDCSGLEIIEVGYYNPSAFGKRTGPSACESAYLDRVAALRKRAAIAVMVHTNEVTLDGYKLLGDKGIDMVRFTVTSKNVRDLPKHAEAARSAGLSFTFNIIRITERSVETVREFARIADGLAAKILYVADSNGALYPDELRRFTAEIREETDVALGLHAHDNLSLAFANAITAIDLGYEYLDSSLGGLGKGGGNLPTELMSGYLSRAHDARYAYFDLASLYESTVLRWMPDPRTTRFRQSLYGLRNMNIDRIAELWRLAKESGHAIDDLLRQECTAGAAPAGRLQEAV